MKTLCLMAEHLYDLNTKLESFCLQHEIVDVVYKIHPEFCVAKIKYR